MRKTQKRRLDRHRILPVALAFGLASASASCTKRREQSMPPSDRLQPFNFIGHKGMVVAAHPLAAEAGRDMLKQGGNAIDVLREQGPGMYLHSPSKQG